MLSSLHAVLLSHLEYIPTLHAVGHMMVMLSSLHAVLLSHLEYIPTLHAVGHMMVLSTYTGGDRAICGY